MTVIELLMVVVIGGMVIVPILGLLTFTLRRHEPVTTMNDQASQLRLFRSYITRDWASARVVRAYPTWPDAAAWPELECNGPAIAGDIHLAMQSALQRRILYKLRDNGDGTVDLIRRECQHAENAIGWGYGGNVGLVDRVIVEDVASLNVPVACNKWGAPFTPCDMSVAVRTVDGQAATVRLRQETGRKS